MTWMPVWASACHICISDSLKQVAQSRLVSSTHLASVGGPVSPPDAAGAHWVRGKAGLLGGARPGHAWAAARALPPGPC